MKKLAIAFASALALVLAAASPVEACDGKGHCDCDHAASVKTAGKTEKVSLEGTVITFGCQMTAEKKQCTGAALVVGETKHLIKKGKKGTELASKARDTNKTVKVTGTKQGDFLTVDKFQIKS
jgi:hypothetical protein